MTKDEYWYWAATIEGLYPNQIKELIDRFGSVEELFQVDADLLLKSNILTKETAMNFIESRKHIDFSNAFSLLEKKGIQFLHIDHPEYPERFRILDDKPFYFYCKGNLPDPNKYSVGMVGARACSPYGKEAALLFSKQLAANDVQIISGMASGVDAYSSEGAILAGGKTFVVLGTGVDVIYPRENTELYYQILMSGGGILSEFPPGTAGISWHFPYRNRLISALSDKLIILEAKNRSGTLTTAQYAMAQNVDVYALPGRITDKVSEGCNKLISDGCGILLSPKYFLEDLFSKPIRCSAPFDPLEIYERNANIREPDPLWANGKPSITQEPHPAQDYCKPAAKQNPEQPDMPISPNMQKVLACLDLDPKNPDRIASEACLSVAETMLALSEMLLYGLAEETSKDLFVKPFSGK